MGIVYWYSESKKGVEETAQGRPFIKKHSPTGGYSSKVEFSYGPSLNTGSHKHYLVCTYIILQKESCIHYIIIKTIRITIMIFASQVHLVPVRAIRSQL